MSHPATSTPPSAEGMQQAAQRALELVQPGMLLGLGTGRAAEAFIRGLGARVAQGLTVTAVTTSERSEKLAKSLSIPLSSVALTHALDIAFDGADEVTDDLQLTKGLGGALLRERVVAHMARRFVILITPEKRVSHLGERAPIPVEVVPFAVSPVKREMQALGVRPVIRESAAGRYFTDNGNYIVDVHIAANDAPRSLDQALRSMPGVVDTGLFLDMADEILIGSSTGVEQLCRAGG